MRQRNSLKFTEKNIRTWKTEVNLVCHQNVQNESSDPENDIQVKRNMNIIYLVKDELKVS